MRQLTVPLATLEEIQQIMMAMFELTFRKGEGKDNVKLCLPVVIVGNVIDHMTVEVEDRLQIVGNNATAADAYAYTVEF